MRRLQLLAGVTFVSAWIIGLVLANGGSEPSDSSQTIAGYYDNHELKSIIATILIDGVAGLAIFLLGYCLWVYSAGVARGLRATVLWAGIVAGFASLVQMV